MCITVMIHIVIIAILIIRVRHIYDPHIMPRCSAVKATMPTANAGCLLVVGTPRCELGEYPGDPGVY